MADSEPGWEGSEPQGFTHWTGMLGHHRAPQCQANSKTTNFLLLILGV